MSQPPDPGSRKTGQPVSRETSLPPAPLPLAVVFGERAAAATEYARILATDGVEQGLLGPREVPRLWERHILNCAAVLPLLPQAADSTDPMVCDVGSGAGLPGLVVALALPDLPVTLLEPLLRRATFLGEVSAALQLDNVRVIRARAEDCVGRISAAAVTARAVAPLERLARWTLPLVAPGGELLAMKGSTADEELATAARVLRQFGADFWHIERVIPWEVAGAAATVVRVRKSASTPPSARRRQRRKA